MTEQQLLPTIEPSENDLVEIAMKTPLDKKFADEMRELL